MDMKSERLTVALSEDEATFVKAAALGNGTSVSEFIREVLVGFMD